LYYFTTAIYGMMKNFPGKIILFGEYTIILGSKALVIPFRRFSGKLEMPEDEGGNADPGIPPAPSDATRSNEALLGLMQYLERMNAAGKLPEEFKLDRFVQQVLGGLHFQSTIPEAYGAGSSGALVAAVYDEFGSGISRFETQDFSRLRKVFSQIESYYHGTSSGIDSLCCYLNKPVLFDGDDAYPVRVPDPPPGTGFFLLDTGRSGVTGPMIDHFQSRLQDTGFREMIHEQVIPLVARNIDMLLEPDARLSMNMHKLSEIQYNGFGRMIPEDFHRIWKNGLQTGLYSLKLCGSGGGGYIIGYTAQWLEAMQYFSRPGFKMQALEV
jgi:mevalonate kinase